MVINKKINKIVSSLEELSTSAPPNISFEFFPPKSEDAEKKLWSAIEELAPLNPEFVSVTYGAGGSTRERTHKTVTKIKRETKLEPAAHLTCVKSSKDEIKEIAQNYWDNGVKHIVALRGDAPEGQANYTASADEYRYASELIRGLKDVADFEISVAAFPEGHPESRSIDADIEVLKAKIDAGATRAITQYFLDPIVYLDFKEKLAKNNITIPVVPGIIMISNFAQFIKFSKLCNANIPAWIVNLLSDLDDTPYTRDMISVCINSEICKTLKNEGVDDFHFYTLNRAAQTKAICRLLGAG